MKSWRRQNISLAICQGDLDSGVNSNRKLSGPDSLARRTPRTVSNTHSEAAGLIEGWEDRRKTGTWADERKTRLRMKLGAEDRELQISFTEKNRMRNKEK